MSDSTENTQYSGLEIAIVGMAGRFPGARNTEEFWRNVRDGVESVTFFSDEELEAEGVPSAVLNDPKYVKAKGVLEGFDLFDAGFFGYSPRDAELMDPQHRHFLECSWEALEDAAYAPQNYKGRIGVFAGLTMSRYLLNLYSNPQVIRTMSGVQILVSNDKDHLPTRVSYKLNLRGPSVNVQTACSTSLVAVHFACQSLLGGECDMALAGGVSIELPVKAGYFYQEGGIESPDGHCRAFDEQARGTIGGSGVGIVVLKRLEDAIRDRDHIRAVIKGSAVNNDGSQKVGYTAPSEVGQSQVIRAAHLMAEVEAETISYVEAHGTGTPLGDPIEVAALTRAFRHSTPRRQFCAIGSVKTNVGHLDAAAGVTGLIKAVLAMEHGELPPSLHYERPNPRIEFGDSPFYVNARLKEWERGESGVRRAGVSSFGIGGTNAHVVLEEAPEQARGTGTRGKGVASEKAVGRGWEVLTVSARSEEALGRACEELSGRLAGDGIELGDAAWTLQVGRAEFVNRRAVVCREAREGAEELREGGGVSGVAGGGEPQVVFMFPGQGAQYVNMAKELYDTEKSFREDIDECAAILKDHLDVSLHELIFNDLGAADEKASSRLAQTQYTQPALFSVEYALARLWMRWGVRPSALIGHSLGEFVAACLSGVMTLEEALGLVSARGRLIQKLEPGAMLAVPLSEHEVKPLLTGSLSISAVNADSLCTVAGPVEAIAALESALSEKGVTSRRLHTSHAFHSEMMGPILGEFAKEVGRVHLREPQLPFVSNVTGEWASAAEVTDPQYWVRHLRQPVRFAEGVGRLLERGRQVLLEVGPGNTLCGLARKHTLKSNIAAAVSSLPRPNEEQSSVKSMLDAVAHAWVNGVNIDWEAMHEGERRRRVSLPTYPFEQKRYWIEAARQTAGGGDSAAAHGNNGHAGRGAELFYAPSWKRSVSAAEASGEVGARWLVFADECGLATELLEELSRRGAEAVVVKRGDRFVRLGRGEYAVGASGEDYEKLVAELMACGEYPSVVAHLWGVTGPESKEGVEGRDERAEGLAQSAGLGLSSLLALTRALGESGAEEEVRVLVVTDGAQEVSGREALRPEKATALGPCLVAPREYARLRCRGVDIEAGSETAEAARALAWEASGEWGVESEVVAYRGGHRWVQTFEPVTPGANGNGATAGIKEGGVYMVTGGLDDMQLAAAEQLARTASVKLVLVESPDARPSVPSDDDPTPSKSIDLEMEQLVSVINQYEESIEGKLKIKALDGHGDFQELADALCLSYALEYFRGGGLDISQGRVYGIGELKEKLRVLPKFDKFLAFLLRMLEEDGFASTDGESICFHKGQHEIAPPAELKERLKLLHPEFKGKIDLLDYCVSNYSRALTGEISAIGILFPDGTSDFIHEEFRDSDTYCQDRIYLELLREVVVKVLGEAGGRKLRMLEVGGGDGNLTRLLLPVMLDSQVEYHFTDLGTSFVRKAQREAVKHRLGFMKFGVFDISKDPLPQGYEPHSFDLVFALNVVHATKSLRETARNLKHLLAPNGLLCLVEVVSLPRWDTMVWGLAEGWWYFEDDDIRQKSPLLKLCDWEKLLHSEGFKSVRAYSQSELKRASSDHGLIIAQQGETIEEDEADAKRFGQHLPRRVLRRLRGLESMGSELLVVRADVSDMAQLEAAVAQARERFGRLDGVLHTLLPAVKGSIGSNVDEIALECSTNVGGALAFDELFGNDGLDFLTMVSTFDSKGGGAEQVSACATSAFLGALTRRGSNGRRSRTSSVVLRDVGGSAAASQNGDARRTRPTNGSNGNYLTLAKGMEAITSVLSRDGAQQLVIAPPAAARHDAPQTTVERPTREREVVAAVGEKAPAAAQARPFVNSAYAEPRNETERRIAGVWRELLGVEQVGIRDDFLELGGESLLALQLVSRLQKLFEVQISLNKVLEAPTVEQLARLVEGLTSARAGGAGGVVAAADSGVVEIQRGTSGLPFAFIHPTGGGLFGYRELARHLGEHQTVYGMQPQGLRAEKKPFQKIEDMAIYYVKSLRDRQPEGPYLIGGASFGGAVAFEMAQQLRAQGHAVALLALFDSPAPDYLPDKPEDDAAILNLLVGNRLSLPLDELRRMDADEQLQYVLEQARAANVLSEGLEFSVAKQVLSIWRANAEALFNYQPKPYDGRIVFFRAKDRRKGLPDYPELPWAELAMRGLEVHIVTGGHESMLQPPHVEGLAERLRRCIGEALRTV